MINLENLKPFPKFCCSIGYIPTSYKVSMTYEEQLFWFCDFLENTVIPTVNQNGQAVEELQNLYIELKNYVDKYFEDLDIQSEINNKLDDMAESGQLTDIIAQYLGLAGVLAFDTVADMKIAENLTNGSIVRTLGYSDIQDTNGSYYKIRNVLNTDVIDDINIIALTNFNNLVAEKIKEKQGMISYLPSYLESDYYYTISYNSGHAYFYISLDGINWQKVFKIPREAIMDDCGAPFDFSCIIDDGYFYFTYDYINRNYNGWSDLDPNLFRGGNKVGMARTQDFVHWEKWNLPIDTQYVQTFAPEFFIDTNGDHYINISLSTTQIKTDDGVSRYYKKNYIIKTDSTFHNIISTTMNVGNDHVNIDGFIYKENDTYYLIVKDEPSALIKIYSSSNINMFNTLVSEVKMIDCRGNNVGIEAPSLIKIGNYYILYVDSYTPIHTTAIFVSDDLVHWSNWNYLNTPDIMYHFTPTKTNASGRELLNIAYQNCNYPALVFNKNVNGMINEYSTTGTNYPYDYFFPLPNSTYIFYGTGSNKTITPNNFFFDKKYFNGQIYDDLTNKDFKVVNASGIVGGRDIIVPTSNQDVHVAPQNAQIFGFNWYDYSCHVYGANLNPIPITLTAGENITINYQDCYRIGNVAFLNVSFTPSANINDWFATILSGAPKVLNGISIPVVQRTDLTESDKWLSINDLGDVYNIRTFTSGKNYRFTISYICK